MDLTGEQDGIGYVLDTWRAGFCWWRLKPEKNLDPLVGVT